ncbi:hypothetical protein [Brevibacterium otitidis]|uniref:Uncharacterized protein n=1 Tax=Brevibacterium otitidis TaxID=53364 RepID=A0ABV5X4V8_9MICO|nr:hypothetical protein GCM10023233_12870 [Brevibacterium otitidis]
MPTTRNELVAAAVHYLYALSSDLPPAWDTTGAVEPESAEVLAADLAEQGRTEPEVSNVFGLIAATRAVLAAGTATAFSKDAYDAARVRAVRGLELAGQAGHQLWPPTSQTVRKRLGANFWNDALSSLGFPTSDGGRRRGTFQYSSEAFHGAVSDFLADARSSGGSESFTSYEAWVKDERAAGRARPAGASVRNYFGNWNDAKDSADEPTDS